MKRTFSPEMKRRIVKAMDEVDHGEKKELCRGYGVDYTLVYRWRAEFRAKENQPQQ